VHDHQGRGRALAAATVGALALAVGLGGCGGGGDGLDKAALVKKVNAICAKYAKEGNDLKAPSDISDAGQAKTFFDKAHDIAKRQQDDLEGLKAAEAVKAQYAAMTKATGKATTLLGQLADAAGAKDLDKGQKLLQQLQPASQQVDKTAGAIGAKRCASA
jgi:hypothetical protein